MTTRGTRRAVLGALFALFATLYFWTATSSGNPIAFGANQSDYYNLLTDGFAAGHLSLIEQPSPALLHLRDPYDPAEQGNLPPADVPHDLSLYRGHFYLSWGPTPVLMLIWPWRLLHVGQLPQNAAALIFSVAGLAMTFLLLELLVARLLAEVRLLRFSIAAIALGLSSVVPYLLRRPLVYEIALAAAYCFISAAAAVFAREFLRERPRPWWIALGATFLGLAIGARVELVVLALPLTVLVYCRWKKIGTGRVALFAAFASPLIVAVALLGAYNAARFGSPFQSGALYQLEGYNPQKTPFFRFGYLWPSLYYYLIAPLRLTHAFPFFALSARSAYPFGVPPTYAPEVASGLVFSAPLALALAGAPQLLRSKSDGALRAVVAVLGSSAVLLVLAICVAVPGATERYGVDFTTLALLGGLLCWFRWQPRRRRGRAALAGLAVSLTGPDDELRTGNSATYRALQDATSLVPLVAVKLLGDPEIVRVIDPSAAYPETLGNYGTTGIATTTYYLEALQPTEVDLVAPRAERVLLGFVVHRTSASVSSGAVKITVNAGTQPTIYRFRRHVSDVINLAEGLNRVFLSAASQRPLITGGQPVVVRIDHLGVSAAPGA